jgi:hypothetical protein
VSKEDLDYNNGSSSFGGYNNPHEQLYFVILESLSTKNFGLPTNKKERLRKKKKFWWAE